VNPGRNGRPCPTPAPLPESPTDPSTVNARYSAPSSSALARASVAPGTAAGTAASSTAAAAAGLASCGAGRGRGGAWRGAGQAPTRPARPSGLLYVPRFPSDRRVFEQHKQTRAATGAQSVRTLAACRGAPQLTGDRQGGPYSSSRLAELRQLGLMPQGRTRPSAVGPSMMRLPSSQGDTPAWGCGCEGGHEDPR
jgi:hypothetical protein